MNATEIVIREVQGDGGFQVRQLLAERIGESGKAPHLHPHGQVLPLDKAGRDVVRIGIASPHLGYNLRDPWWGVPPLNFCESTPKRFLVGAVARACPPPHATRRRRVDQPVQLACTTDPSSHRRPFGTLTPIICAPKVGRDHR